MREKDDAWFHTEGYTGLGRRERRQWGKLRLVPLIGKMAVFEVHYNDEDVPWGFCYPSIFDKWRHRKEWKHTPSLTYPDDFTGKAPWEHEETSESEA